MPSFRHQSRQLVLQALFAEEFQPDNKSGFLDYIIDNFGSNLPEIEFTKKLYWQVKANLSKSLKIITEYAPDWPIEKIAVCDKYILCIGLTELLFFQEAPALVALNEAIELAKDFGNDNSSKFINAVLSKAVSQKLGEEVLDKPKVNAK